MKTFSGLSRNCILILKCLLREREITTTIILIHLKNFPKFQKEKVLTCTQFYNIWGVLIHFSTKTPEDIIEYVFKKHIETQNTLENSKMLNYSRLDHFLNTYKDYFNRKEKDYILNEVRFT